MMPMRHLLLLFCIPPRAAALSFTLGAQQQRCVSESIPAKSLLTGD